jgi:hypothetical protein
MVGKRAMTEMFGPYWDRYETTLQLRSRASMPQADVHIAHA